jgi:hypothetical protein
MSCLSVSCRFPPVRCVGVIVELISVPQAVRIRTAARLAILSLRLLVALNLFASVPTYMPGSLHLSEELLPVLCFSTRQQPESKYAFGVRTLPTLIFPRRLVESHIRITPNRRHGRHWSRQPRLCRRIH